MSVLSFEEFKRQRAAGTTTSVDERLVPSRGHGMESTDDHEGRPYAQRSQSISGDTGAEHILSYEEFKRQRAAQHAGMPNTGQAGANEAVEELYAALRGKARGKANAWLDALAEARRAATPPALRDSSPYAGEAGAEGTQSAYQRRMEEKAALESERDALREAYNELNNRFMWGRIGVDYTEEDADRLVEMEERLRGYDEQLRGYDKNIEWDGRGELVREYEQLWLKDFEGIATEEEQARLQEVDGLLRTGDEAVGNEPQYYGAAPRVSGAAHGALGNVGSSLLNAGATAWDWLKNSASVGGQTIGQMISDDARGISEAERDAMYAAQAQRAHETLAPVYEYADRLGADSTEAIEKAKGGLGRFGKAAVDIGTNVLQMGFDAGVGALTGGGSLASMGLRVFGQSAMEARQKGASLDQQAAYGLVKVGIEVFTEKLFGGDAGIYGEGYADDLTASVIARLTDSDAGAALLYAAVGANQEGMEEVISDLLAPFAERIVDDEAIRQWIDEGWPLDELLYDYLIGAAVGSLGEAVSLASGETAGKIAEAREENGERQVLRPRSIPNGETSERAESGETPELRREPLERAETQAEQANSGTPGAASFTEGTESREVLRPRSVPNGEANERAESGETPELRREPLETPKQNIDNAGDAGYTGANEETSQEVAGNGTGRSAEEDHDGVSGVYEGRNGNDQGRAEPDGASVDTGLVLLSQEGQNTLKQSGVYAEVQETSADNAAFSASLDEAREADTNNGWAVAPKSAEELAEAGTRTFLTADGSAGFAVAKDGDIEAVFANKTKGAPKGVTRSTIPQAIANGGVKLDCYGDALARLYSKHGFVPVAKVAFNPEYANPGWDESKGKPDIYFMMYTGDGAEDAVQNYGNYPVLTKSELDALPVMEYDEAYTYRDRLLEEQRGGAQEKKQPPVNTNSTSGLIWAGSETAEGGTNGRVQGQSEDAARVRGEGTEAGAEAAGDDPSVGFADSSPYAGEPGRGAETAGAAGESGERPADGGRGRDAGARAGGKAERLAERTKRHRERAREQRERADHLRRLGQSLWERGEVEYRSAQELGIPEGSDTPNLLALPEEHLDERLKALRERVQAETGYEDVIFVLGAIRTAEGGKARGAVVDGKLIIQADDLSVPAEAIAEHEIFHVRAQENPGLLETMRRKIAERFSPEELRRRLDSYIDVLTGGILKTDAESADAQEQAEIAFEELCADAYADINFFGFGADEYGETVRETVKERREARQADSERVTRGPPETRWSVSEDFEDENAEVESELESENAFTVNKADERIFNPEGKNLDEVLKDILHGAESFDGRYLYFGRFTQDFRNFLADNGIAAKDLPVVMNFRDAYLSMENKENGRYKGDGINYHGIGLEGMREAMDNLMQPSEVMASSKPGKVELALDFTDSRGQRCLAIVELNTVARNAKQYLEAHVINSIYGKRNIERYIDKARQEGRLLQREKEDLSPVNSQVQYKGIDSERSSERVDRGPVSEAKSSRIDSNAITTQPNISISEERKKSNTKFSMSEEDADERIREHEKSAESFSRESWPDIPEGMSADEYVKAAAARAEKEKQEQLRRIPRDEFTGTENLRALGIRVDNSVGNYAFTDRIIANNRAAKSIRRQLERAERRLKPTAAEKEFASAIAAGTFTAEDIPARLDRRKVEELADYYDAERGISSDLIGRRRKGVNQALDERMESLFPASGDEQYKPAGMVVLNNRTPERNMRQIFGDTKGEEINREIFYPVQANEAERIRFVNRMHEEVRRFAGKDGREKRLNKTERALVQMLIEGKAAQELVAGMEMRAAIESAGQNIQKATRGVKSELKRAEIAQEAALDAAREFGLNADEANLAKRYARWLEALELLESGKADSARVKAAVKKYSEMFGKFYDAINDFLVAHGYDPIGFIKGYAPHMQPEENRTMLNKAFQALGIGTDVTRLPSSIAGLTADYKPNKRWNPYFLQRVGDLTEYDIASAYESYVEYMSDVLYHTDDIMRVRAMSRHFRRTYAPENIRDNLDTACRMRYASQEEKADFLRGRGVLSRESALSEADTDRMLDEYVDKLLEDAGKTTKYSDLVMWIDNYANTLAAKQSIADRGWEYAYGRKVLNLGNRLTRAFAKANVAGNLSSALNQTAQFSQIRAELGAKHVAQALADNWNGRLRRGAWAQESDFLTGKNGIDYLVNDWQDMLISGMFKPADFMDGFMATLAVRGRYRKEIENGKSHSEAMRAADRFGREIMGSRMKGARPTAYDAKNPVSQMLHIFQLEAVNSWEHLRMDLPRDFRTIEAAKGKKAAAGALAGVIVKMLLSAFLLNRLGEEVYGGTPAPFDIIGLTANFIASGKGLTTNRWLKTLLDNGMEKLTGERLFGTERDEGRENFDLEDALEELGYNVSNDIPFFRNFAGLMGWGDNSLPIPNLYETASNVYKTAQDNGMFSSETGKALLKGAAEWVPAGRQAMKTTQGLQLMGQGGHYVNNKLYYPVENSWQNWVKALLFGRSSLYETKAYYAGDDKSLSEKQTEIYRELTGDGADRMEVYEAIQDWKAVSADGMLGSYEKGRQQREVVKGLDATDEQKLRFYQTMSGSDSRAEKFESMMEAGLSLNECFDAYDAYARIDADENKTKNEKANAFAAWVSRQDYSATEKDAVMENLKYWQMVPITGTKTEKLTDVGIETDEAEKLAETLMNLTPLPGQSQVTELQKYQAVAESELSVEDQWRAITAMTPESYTSTRDKIEIMRQQGITPTVWTESRAAVAEADDGNGNTSQAEAKAALDGMDIPTWQKAVLWQTINKSWKAENNPYDTGIGETVYAQMHGETSGGLTLGTWG